MKGGWHFIAFLMGMKKSMMDVTSKDYFVIIILIVHQVSISSDKNTHVDKTGHISKHVISNMRKPGSL